MLLHNSTTPQKTHNTLIFQCIYTKIPLNYPSTHLSLILSLPHLPPDHSLFLRLPLDAATGGGLRWRRPRARVRVVKRRTPAAASRSRRRGRTGSQVAAAREVAGSGGPGGSARGHRRHDVGGAPADRLRRECGATSAARGRTGGGMRAAAAPQGVR